MAKPIVLQFEAAESRFDFKKVTRDKLYGRKRRIPLGRDGKPCARVSLDVSTGLVLRSGMTAQGYFSDAQRWIPNGQLVGLDKDLKPIDRAPSTLGVAQNLRGPLEATEVLDLAVSSIYQLEAQALDEQLEAALAGGAVFGFDFNYRSDYQTEQAVLLKNDSGYFALVGQPNVAPWCELEAAPLPVEDDELGDEDDDLDFEMF